MLRAMVLRMPPHGISVTSSSSATAAGAAGTAHAVLAWLKYASTSFATIRLPVGPSVGATSARSIPASRAVFFAKPEAEIRP